MAALLGVDTGGTHTDAALVDATDGEVLAAAKVPTTHDDLAVGVGGAVDAVMSAWAHDRGRPVTPDDIALVSLSTTLATNALVEGTTRRAALVLVGFDDDVVERGGLTAAIDDTPVIRLAGGHSSHGDEVGPLDVDAAEAAVAAIDDAVDAVAVAAQFSVRNPSHEIAVRDLITNATGLPVTCSHELSDALDGPRRALTALLNARLVAMITDLVEAASSLLSARGIGAPLMVMRGNGSLVSADVVRSRPIETILSGPAASVMGATHLVSARDAVVADIGGTTTDIAVVRDGRPRVTPTGATVGGHRTMVEAVAMTTQGLGGDSRVGLVDRALGPQLTLGPQRVTPLVRAARTSAAVIDTLERQLEADRPGELDGILVAPGQSHGGRPPEPGTERSLVARVSEAGIVAMDELVRSRVELRSVERLAARGRLRVSSLTPTDAAHVLGLLDDLEPKAAHLGARLFARRRDRSGSAIASSADELASVVIDTVVRRSAEAVLAAGLDDDGLAADDARSPLVSAALEGRPRTTRIEIGLALPVVGLGAPAPTYHPRMAELLGTTALVPIHAGVANAVGAAVGLVRSERSILVSAPRRGVYRVHAGADPLTLFDHDEARRAAEAAAAEAAAGDARRAGAADPTIELRWHERTALIEDRPYFVEGTATAVASGRPGLA